MQPQRNRIAVGNVRLQVYLYKNMLGPWHAFSGLGAGTLFLHGVTV